MTSNLTVRASSWGALFDCAYKWEGEHLLGIRKPAGVKALLGTSVHASTAVFDKGRVAHVEVRPDDAADVLVQTLRHPEFDVDLAADDMTIDEAERIGLTLHTKYCLEVSPQFEYSAVEMTLEPMVIDCGGDVTVTLTGTMDRARIAATKAGNIIPDIKTGTRVIEKGAAKISGRSAQLGTYELMYEHTTGERSVGAQVIALATTSKPAVAVSPIFDARKVMVGTDKQRGLIEYAAEMFHAGLFPPNPQSFLCSPKFCARWNTCIFHE